MSNSAIRQGRLDKVMNRPINWGSEMGVMSYEQLRIAGAFGACRVVKVPSVQYNRRKWNRMDCDEQRAYQEKLDTMKSEYQVEYIGPNSTPDDVIIIPKIVFDHLQHFSSEK